MSNIIIQTINLNDMDDYNSNNHWKDDKPPDDYKEYLSLTNFNNYIDLFHKDYITITLDKTDINILNEIFKISHLTCKVSNLYKEEFEDLLKKYKYTDKYFQDKQYFVRTNLNSLKYGKFGKGPYTNFKDIITSMVTSTKTHKAIDSTIYLLPWLNLDKKEFRIFVYKNRITCISQQNTYSIIFDKSTDFITLSKDIVNFYETNIKSKITYIDNYVIDLGIIGDSFYFIELNPFGKEYSSGSALFHWINDEEKIYNIKNNNVYFRYLI